MGTVLRNPYLIGFLIFLTEIAINLPFGNNVISGVLLAFIVGYWYGWYVKEKMTPLDRLKLIGVYLGLIAFVGFFSLMAKNSALGFPTIALIAMATLLIYGALMYFGLYFSSYLGAKAEAKHANTLQKKANSALPPK